MSLKKSLLILSLLLIPLFGYLFWHFSTPPTLTTNLSSYQKAGEEVKSSFSSLPALPIQEEDKQYTIEDNTKDGIQITYANKEDNTALAATPDAEKPSLTLHFPKQYATDPIEVQIAEGKSILIQDKQAKGDYTAQSLSLGGSSAGLAGSTSKLESDKAKVSNNPISWLQSLLGGSTSKLEEERAYLSYTDATKRITTYYAYGHDQATGEKQLKNWQVYDHPAIVKGEQVAYSFTNAKLKKNENGTISVYYYGDQELQNDKAASEVDPSLMARAQRTLAKEMGDSIDSGETPANFVIPKPYYINNNGDTITLDWRLSMDGKDISIDFTPEANEYPLALDPTLSFTAPGMSNTGDVITGEATNNYFGYAMTTGDFNADSKTDLAVGAYGYSGNTGRAYIFYNDGGINSQAANADVIITGYASSYFGRSMAAGDLNSDSRTDLIVSDNDGHVRIFYNDGAYPTTSATADIIISGSGETLDTLTTGDFNADGRTDLAVGSVSYSSNTGRVYVFYNDGVSLGTAVCTTGCLASNADALIVGEAAGNVFGGSALAAGDLNADGKTDLIVGAIYYSTGNVTGRAYIFYNGAISTKNASAADVIITGELGSTQRFGSAFAVGDFNADGKVDLAVGAYYYSSTTGRAYIFYADGTNNFGTATCSGTPALCSAADADVIITGEGGYFGIAMTSGDFNADGRMDLVVGAYTVVANYGRAYIFYNDGSIPTTAATADVIITGEPTIEYMGFPLAAGDFNADGRTDLAAGAFGYASQAGRTYIFYSQNGQVNTNQNITGNASGDYFGSAMTTGDFNADGRTDLAVGANGYSTDTGRVYIFYNDGSIPTTAATADVTITGEATGNFFGDTLTAGDFNSDGRTDLTVAADRYSTNTGRVYIFYNDGSIPTTAATADVIITGEATNNYFGLKYTVGDFNADGRTDLAVGSFGYSSSTGRAYIFYNDGSIPTTAATADVTITGETTSNNFGAALTSGDFNADGRTDLAVGANSYSSGTGRAYIFYNDGSVPTTAATADVTITGEATSSGFGYSLITGDFNSDGRIDLVVGANNYSTNTGRAYIFYNDGTIPTTAATADVTITGETTSNRFANTLTTGDFNADGRTDLAVGALQYTTFTGRAYIFYNDGSIPTTAATADVTITGEATSNSLGCSLTAGDFNSDGKTDLAVGAYGYSTNTGRVYFYETRENFAWKLQALSPDTGGLRTGLSGTGQEMKITGNAASDQFGYAMTPGDFNADGKTDLAVGAQGYSTNTGRVYLFYNDGSLSPGASGADVIITGEATSNYFGTSLTTGDFNSDGKTDLAVGAYGYSTNTGRAYIFYNDGSISTTAATADVTITGNATSDYFGASFAAGDFNADGRTDLVASAYGYSTFTGRAYIFYNDGFIPTTATTADVIITGGAALNLFGFPVIAGDFNADGRTDLAVGAYFYPDGDSTGRAYIFYNDGSIPTTAATADVTITGETTNNNFGGALASGDFNADGKTDLAVGAYLYSSFTGRAYIFYNDGSIPTTAATADVTITGETTSNYFGISLVAGDFNTDGRTDLAVGASRYSSYTGRAYIFYNDGSIPTTATTADIIITGEATSNYFGYALTAGDLNADGKTDLVVGAYGYSGSKGRAYIYTFNDPVITGETTNNSFGTSLISGDFNADGKTDLAVGASGYSTNTGRVYLFYQDGTIASTAASADVIITGEATNNYFGYSLTAGDLNADGKTDLAVGALGYSSDTGRAYIFYNDGSIPTTAGTADVIITGGATGDNFGFSLVSGDFNADGRIDLATNGVNAYASNGGIYIFYNDGSIPTTAATADVTIAGAGAYTLGTTLAAGDVNADGRTDIMSNGQSSTGVVRIFYNDGSYPATSATADVNISGQAGSYFGVSFTVGDFNNDGKIDLAVGGEGYTTSTGRTYIFYADGTSDFGNVACSGSPLSCSASNADLIITGETTNNYFGHSLVAGDFNADGRTDLVVGASGYSTNTGRAYIFYNDGISFGTVACTTGCLAVNADVILTGETTDNYFGWAFTAGDFNADGRADLVVGAYRYSSYTGRVYLFTSEAKVDSAPPATARVRGTAKLRGTSTLR